MLKASALPCRIVRSGVTILAFVVAVCFLRPATEAAAAEPAGDFFAGKTITLVIGADVGGGYDAAGRLIARFLGRFIPGAPTLIVQNMPAGGSLPAAHYL